ncbi:DNA translocase FtsK 4TM domain-containing protein [Rickettsiaceae bacterium]|nr:DNA translocase FtsK 4TM domain-containing protein [Rickettsiaceae bacterium]
MTAYIKAFLMHYKIQSLMLLSASILLTVSLASYSPTDPSFNSSSNNIPDNILFYFGSYLSDGLYQILGLSAFILPICMVFWSYIIFRYQKLNHSLLRIISMVIAICFSSIAFSELRIEYLPSESGGILGITLYNTLTHFDHFLPSNPVAGYGIVGLAIISFMLSLGISVTAYKNLVMHIARFMGKVIGKFGILQRFVPSDSSNAYYPEDEFSSINVATSSSLDKKHKSSLSKNSTKIPDKTSCDGILPPISLLDDGDAQSFKPQTQAELNKNAESLLSVLQDFGINGKIIDIKEGPVVTLYEFEPSAGIKSSRVIGLADDIARSLSAISARIAVIAGRNALGIELPNKKRMFFRLKELLHSAEFQSNDISLPLILGKDLGGEPLIVDLASMPHLLVAGTTGSGKSVAINAMIMSILYRYTPLECKMIMIDPKMLELSAYDNIPHLITPVVTDAKKAVVALKWAVKEMENRYRLMSHLGVRNITNYNLKIADALKRGQKLERKIQTGFDPETGNPINDTVSIDMKKMPFIVVIVDEMADLMVVAGKDIESSVQRLAQMARAAGIHIIMATQRPSVDVITGVIKANFPSRISFKVTSKIDSRTILGQQGSEQLLGMGDMLYMGSSAKISRVHGPFVADKEVEKVANFLRENGDPEYIEAITEPSSGDIESDMLHGDDDQDDTYSKALNIVTTERKSSISYIQRSLRIGYNRAANIVEQMEKNGVLSEPNHSGKREILLPKQ